MLASKVTIQRHYVLTLLSSVFIMDDPKAITRVLVCAHQFAGNEKGCAP